jgi:flagellar protein FliL
MNNKIMIILGGVICLLLVAFGVLFFMMWTKISALDDKASISAEASMVEGEGVKKLGPIFSLESFIVNLDDPKFRKYLRVTMDIELVEEQNKQEIEERLPQIRDSILTILPSKHYEEVISIDGKNQLRTEMLTTLNSFFNREIITNIYFTEFVIQ